MHGLRLVRVARNWYAVMLYYVLHKRVILELRNGLKFEYSPKLFSAENFLEHPYSLLEVKRRVCVDIGAFNGDTAISFEKRGALSVLAFELSPKAFEIAERNIQLNKCNNIRLFNQGVSGVKYTAFFDFEQASGPTVSLSKVSSVAKRGAPVIIRTLESIVDEFGLLGAVLKIDCEGCEYEIIENSGPKTLGSFSEIALECHGDPRPIIEKLDAVGFETRLFKIPYWLFGMRTESIILATTPSRRNSKQVPEPERITTTVSIL